MPLQNRVTPTGEIIATSARGTMLGNRGGRFHTDKKVLTRRRWATKQWICCVTEFKNRHREIMQPRGYTELFFLDEATAFAAGHRPCFECRREDAVKFATLWNEAQTGDDADRARAPAMDEVLHAERLGERASLSSIDGLPNGSFVMQDKQPYLIYDATAFPWTPQGYGLPIRGLSASTNQPVQVLTAASILAVFSAGYCPIVHDSAGLPS